MIKRLKRIIKPYIFKPQCRIDGIKYKMLFPKLINKHIIGIYFASPVSGIYQLKQWFPIFNELNKKKKVLIITRAYSTYKYIIENTNFDIIYLYNFKDLVNTYENINLKLIFYVNNGVKNFQSLKCNRVFHIHINHGESNKKSTVSNQVNAYNYIYIVSQAAYDKYKNNLLETNMSKFIKVGRPQLEYVEDLFNINTDKKIVLYAPTWEGNHDSDNHTSIEKLGKIIVDTIISSKNYFLVYKPHPYTGIRSSKIYNINKKIIEKIKNCNNAIYIDSKLDILSIYKKIDIAILDNSAITIDYLSFDKPYLITNVNSEIFNISKFNIYSSAKHLNIKNINRLIDIINYELKYDTCRMSRLMVKKYFLGDINYNKYESTKVFIDTTLELIKIRDIKIKKFKN